MSKKTGEELFDQFYRDFFKDRWPSLKESLRANKKHTLLLSPFFKGDRKSLVSFNQIPNAFNLNEEMNEDSIDSQKYFYFLDGASLYAPYFLNPTPGDDILDLCAAPGGKSLFLAYALKGEGTLTANDKSDNRRGRLKKVLSQYLPKEFYDEKIKITGHDAGRWCLYQKEAYDKILLDVPCSSERHVLASPPHLKEWKMGRSKRLSKNQWTMLASAFQVLRPGGLLVYSTCSISPLENDNVVEKLFKKNGDEAELIRNEIPGGEVSQFGTWLLPDHCDLGPFYLSVIRKMKTK